MRKLMFVKILFLSVLYTFSSVNSQTYDLRSYFLVGVGHESWITFDYEYAEFNNSSHHDSSSILESFHGNLTISDYSIEFNADTIKYNLLISKEGTKVLRTFYDTLSAENIELEYIDSVFVIEGIKDIAGDGYIFGWIFPDTLVESIYDTSDSIPMYPYSRLYSYYDINKDDSLFYSNDTLFIHYRPKYNNNVDSYYSIDYKLYSMWDILSYSRYYSYFGEGFFENYKFKSVKWASVNNPNENNLANNISLSQNYPNPFNPITKINYQLPKSNYVKIYVADILGSEIEILEEGYKNAGFYEIEFDGSRYPSGVYIYSINNSERILSKKMLILK